MTNPRLTDEQRFQADDLLSNITEQLNKLSGGDKPGKRRRLKRKLYKTQNGLCGMCRKKVELKGSELDRTEAPAGYNELNVTLVCHECHTSAQAANGNR
jgi:hypothetical protein